MTRHVSEIVHSNERVLIVSKPLSRLSGQLIKSLEEYDVAIQRATSVPPSYERFNRIFFINIKPDSELVIPRGTKTTVVLVKPFGKQIGGPTIRNHIKYIYLASENITEEEMGQILWFSISSGNEQVLDLRTDHSRHSDHTLASTKSRAPLQHQSAIRIAIAIFVLICVSFIIPLIPATLLHITMLDSYTKDDYTPVTYLQPLSNALTQASSTLYLPARPIYSLFSLSLAPESYLRFNSHTENYFITTKQLSIAQQQLLRNLTSQQWLARVTMLNLESQKYLDRIITNIPNFQSLERLKASLKNRHTISQKISEALPIVSAITSDSTDQLLMILITNNTRARGAGGVIDSVGIVNISNHKITSSHFYTSRQLKSSNVNLEELSPILVTYTPAEATELNDATTSVDLFDTQEKIRVDLSSLLNGRKPTMTLLVTTTAMQNILDVFPELQLSGGKEIITSENFSIKQRLYGSNPTFMPVVVNRMSEALGTVNLNSLFSTIIHSFNEKQLALLSSRPSVQKRLDGLYWSGKTISPKCIASTAQCINDYLFSVDQDLSDREGSSYVQKSESKTVRFLDSRTMESTVRISWKNESPLPPENGGVYRLYTQILLPQNSTVSQITKNNVLVEQIDTLSGQYNILGLYLEIEPQHTAELAITYTMPVILRETTNYQLITQKQLGSFTGNISFDLLLPDSYILGSTNVDAVVNNQRISYNGILNTDKLFFVQIKRKN